MSQFHANVRGADFLQARIDGVIGQLGAIALAAEVTQIEVPQVRGYNLFGRLRRSLV